MSKLTGFLCMAFGAAMLIAALGLLLYNRAEDEAAGSAAELVMPELISSIKAQTNVKGEAEPEEPTEMTVKEIDGESYIGFLSIPVFELELPIMSDWDESKLKTAPCRYYGSTNTDNLVICGHNYNKHFGRLKNLQPGDMVLFTDMDGETTAYEVFCIELLQPSQIREMLESRYELTLFTCTYGGQSRITVRCCRIEDIGE